MGGGVIRVAAKAAALSGYRSAESALSRRPPRFSAGPAAAGEAPGLSVAMQPAPAEVVVRATEFDDWEFAGGEEELSDQMPRMVFGSVPTLEEAKEATMELKDAIEKVYFPPLTPKESPASSQVSIDSEKSTVVPNVPKHVSQAFSLLQGNSEAQNVVAALASDENVWNAIMMNDKVMQFYKTQEAAVHPPAGSVVIGDYEESVGSSESAVSEEQSSESSPLWDLVSTIKLGVSEMVSNISNLLQDFLGPPAGTASTGRHATSDSFSVGIGASFFALAIAAILVVLLKRGA